MTKANTRRALALLALAAACGRAPDAERQAAEAAPDPAAMEEAELEGPLSCPDPATGYPATSLIYSDLVQDTAETGDVAGLEIVLRDSVGVWSGRYREGAGELGPWQPLASVSLNPRSRDVTFVLRVGQDSARFRGNVTCRRLAGEMRAFGAELGEDVAFPRARRLWDAP